MAYRHGVYTSERATSLSSPVSASAGLPVYVGSAPVNQRYTKAQVLAGDASRPVLAFNFAEAVSKIGYTAPVAGSGVYREHAHSLSQALDVQFRLYGAGPVVLINVLGNDGSHVDALTDEVVVLDSGSMSSADSAKFGAAFLETLVVKDQAGTTTFVEGVDYVASFSVNGGLVLALIDTGGIGVNDTLTISADTLDPAALTESDVVGGVDGVTGVKTGLELVSEVFPRFGLVPGLLLCALSEDPAVAALMKAKADAINGLFTAMSIPDVASPDDNTAAPLAKATANTVSPQQIATYGRPILGDVIYRMAPHVAGVIGRTDAANEALPYVSPSNEPMEMNGLVSDNEIEVFLGADQATYLNGQGLVTALNFDGGWKLFGNRTAVYPSSSDPKDAFIPVRRMMNWVRNTIILTFWKNVDDPLNLVLVQSVLDSVNLWLNGLTSRGAILGGRAEFRQSENPTTDLMDGIARINVFLTPPSPAREISFIVEYDPSYLDGLFA